MKNYGLATQVRCQKTGKNRNTHLRVQSKYISFKATQQNQRESLIEKDNVVAFCLGDNVSTALPGKRNSKTVKKRVRIQ